MSFIQVISDTFICGPGCVGKTTLLKKYTNVVFTDFFERSKKNPEYLKKGTNVKFQLLYTLEWFTILNKSPKSPIKKIYDRSPYSDLFYAIIMHSIAENLTYGAAQKLYYKEIQSFPDWLFDTIHIIFIIPTITCAPLMLEKSIKRDNKIDIMNIGYHHKQILFFSILREQSKYRIGSKFEFIEVTPETIYTDKVNEIFLEKIRKLK